MEIRRRTFCRFGWHNWKEHLQPVIPMAEAPPLDRECGCPRQSSLDYFIGNQQSKDRDAWLMVWLRLRLLEFNGPGCTTVRIRFVELVPQY